MFTDVPLNTRIGSSKAAASRPGRFGRDCVQRRDVRDARAGARRGRPGCTNRFRRRTFRSRISAAAPRSLAALRGKPAIVLLWSFDAAASRAALETLGRGAQALARAGVGSIAIAVEHAAGSATACGRCFGRDAGGDGDARSRA